MSRPMTRAKFWAGVVVLCALAAVAFGCQVAVLYRV